MTFYSGIREYALYFEYPKPEPGKSREVWATVIVIVADGKRVELVARGVSRCHPKDQFRRKVGRDKAFGHLITALAAAGWSREYRQVVGAAYKRALAVRPDVGIQYGGHVDASR